jgi:hypothetical protein
MDNFRSPRRICSAKVSEAALFSPKPGRRPLTLYFAQRTTKSEQIGRDGRNMEEEDRSSLLAEVPMAHPPVDDPLLEARIAAAIVEEALAPLRDDLSPDDLSFYEDALAVVLTTHPSLEPLFDMLHPRAVPSESGDVPLRDAATLEAAAHRHAARKQGAR